jgi:hypothetical protein
MYHVVDAHCSHDSWLIACWDLRRSVLHASTDDDLRSQLCATLFLTERSLDPNILTSKNKTIQKIQVEKRVPSGAKEIHNPSLIQRRHHNPRSPRKPHRQRRFNPQRPSGRIPHPVQLVIHQLHIISPQHLRQNHAHLDHCQTVIMSVMSKEDGVE